MSNWFDLDYNESDYGDKCNWEGNEYAEPCGNPAVATLYFNRWDGEEMVDAMEIKICNHHLAKLAGVIISAIDCKEQSQCS